MKYKRLSRPVLGPGLSQDLRLLAFGLHISPTTPPAPHKLPERDYVSSDPARRGGLSKSLGKQRICNPKGYQLGSRVGSREQKCSEKKPA